MPYPEVKSERYALGGGLNNKVSRFVTGQQELIRCINYDFSVPGALTKRPDTSQFLGTSFGQNIQHIFEQTYLNGVSYRFVYAFTGAYFSGTTTTPAYYGWSTASFGGASYFFTPINGTTYIAGLDLNRISSVNTVNNYWAANVPVTQKTPAKMVNRFVRWHATLGYFAEAQMAHPVGSFTAFGVSYFAGAGGFFKDSFGYRFSLAYTNERGVVGPATPVSIRPYIQGQGSTQLIIKIPNFNDSGVLDTFYQYAAFATMLLFRDTIGVTAAQLGLPDVAVTTAIFAIPMQIGNTYIIDQGTGFSTSSANGATWLMDPIAAGGIRQNDYWRFSPLENLTNPPLVTENTLIGVTAGIKRTGAPQFLAVLNNMMFYSGFSMAPSHVFWSQLGTPEWVANDDYNEVRTDNGDVVVGMIPYQNAVIVGKRFSLHEVTGTSPDTISFNQTTSQYGFINNRSMAAWNNNLWFIDGSGKGICEYNGAQTEIISVKVEDVFKRINLTAAISTAWMLHVKQRNEVWAAIPVDGATTPNVIVVYDYVAQAWTTYEGLAPNVAAICKGSLTLPVPVMGFSNGDIRYMNATYTGAEFMTTVVRFPFVTNFGWSTTQVFRRLYVDVDPVVGMTHLFNANFYLNDSNTVSLTRGITTTSHQTRIDFGLPGNGMSVELIEGSTLATRIPGYTVESRFQRNV